MTEVKSYPLEKAAIVGQMIGPKRFITLLVEFGQIVHASCVGLSADVLKVFKAGGCHQKHRGRIGIADGEDVSVSADLAAVRDHAHLRLETQSAGFDLPGQC